MKARGFDALRLDVEAFAAEGGSLEGGWPLGELARLAASASDDGPMFSARRVDWRASGHLRQPRVGEPEIWLEVHAESRLPLQCQRCLKSVDVDVVAQRRLRFVAGEKAAAELDEQCDDDVLALTRALDLHDLIEDEMILALPLVPTHGSCPEPLVVPADDLAPDEPAAHPFAALAALRAAKPGGSA